MGQKAGVHEVRRSQKWTAAAELQPTIPKPDRLLGRVLSALVVAFLLLDAGIKLVPVQPVNETLRALDFEPTALLARGLGVLLLVSTLLYAVPRTALLGPCF